MSDQDVEHLAAQNGSVEVEGAVGPSPTESISQPGVVVYRVPGDTPGSESIQIAPINGMDPLAVPTLLRIAIRMHEQQLGIPNS